MVDFAKLKERVPIERAIPLLNLTMRQQGVQFRGLCPACTTGGERALAINTDKRGYYCFAQQKGGDIIALVAHVRGTSQRDAAEWIEAQDHPPSTVSHTSTSPSPQGKELKPLDYLVFNEEVGGLGVGPETCAAWGAGYASKGIMRGRFAVPIHSKDGVLLAYVGIAVSKEQSPHLHFPNGFDPHSVIFGAERVKPGDLFLLRDPLHVLTAYENGMENVVAFLAPITPQMLEQLAALMDEKKIEAVELF